MTFLEVSKQRNDQENVWIITFKRNDHLWCEAPVAIEIETLSKVEETKQLHKQLFMTINNKISSGFFVCVCCFYTIEIM